jgi:NTP pyrophosphatase (non-canonical NTP hydrolase)
MSPLAEIQKRAEAISRRYETSFGIAPGDDWILFKLQEELGELTQAYLAATARSRRKLEGAAGHEAMSQEIADVLGFVLALAERLGIDAGAAFEAKWARYEAAS